MIYVLHAFLIVFFIVFVYILFLYVHSCFYTFYLNVPYVPSNKKFNQFLIKNFDFSKSKVIADLGCGDGSVLFALQKHYPNKTFLGYEITFLPLFVYKIKSFFLKTKLNIKRKNFLKEDLRHIDTMFVYLFPGVMQKLYKYLLSFNQDFTLISRDFKVENIEPTNIIKNEKYKLYVYEIKSKTN